jgi:hypothetical protein
LCRPGMSAGAAGGHIRSTWSCPVHHQHCGRMRHDISAGHIAASRHGNTHLQYDRDLAEVALGAALHQRDVGRKTHAVDMVAGTWGDDEHTSRAGHAFYRSRQRPSTPARAYRCDAHPWANTKIVEGVEAQCELLKEVDPKLFRLDVAMVRRHLRMRIEPPHRLCRSLHGTHTPWHILSFFTHCYGLSIINSPCVYNYPPTQPLL